MDGLSTPTSQVSQSQLDETSWDLLRDEWELCAAIGSGPTTLASLGVTLGVADRELTERLNLLERYGIVSRTKSGFRLVSVVHQRQESVTSYVRELLLERVSGPDAESVYHSVRWDEEPSDEAPAHIVARLREGVIAPIVELASQPRHPDEEAYVFALAFTSAAQVTEVGDALAVLDIVHRASMERCTPGLEDRAKIWVADMRVAREVAAQVCGLVENGLSDLPPVSGQGAVAFGLWRLKKTPSSATMQGGTPC